MIDDVRNVVAAVDKSGRFIDTLNGAHTPAVGGRRHVFVTLWRCVARIAIQPPKRSLAISRTIIIVDNLLPSLPESNMSNLNLHTVAQYDKSLSSQVGWT
ncbi:hypothetical protein AAFN47_11225 [Hoeflea sp. CAU 1731]